MSLCHYYSNTQSPLPKLQLQSFLFPVHRAPVSPDILILVLSKTLTANSARNSRLMPPVKCNSGLIWDLIIHSTSIPSIAAVSSSVSAGWMGCKAKCEYWVISILHNVRDIICHLRAEAKSWAPTVLSQPPCNDINDVSNVVTCNEGKVFKAYKGCLLWKGWHDVEFQVINQAADIRESQTHSLLSTYDEQSIRGAQGSCSCLSSPYRSLLHTRRRILRSRRLKFTSERVSQMNEHILTSSKQHVCTYIHHLQSERNRSGKD